MNKETVATYMFVRPEKFENAFRLMIRLPLFDKILKQDDKEISVRMSTAIVCVFFLCPLNDNLFKKSYNTLTKIQLSRKTIRPPTHEQI